MQGGEQLHNKERPKVKRLDNFTRNDRSLECRALTVTLSEILGSYGVVGKKLEWAKNGEAFVNNE